MFNQSRDLKNKNKTPLKTFLCALVTFINSNNLKKSKQNFYIKFLKNLKLLDDNHAVGNTSLVTPLLELPTFLGCTSHILEYPF